METASFTKSHRKSAAPPAWIERVYQAGCRDQIDVGLDELLRAFNQLFQASRFARADSLLQHLDLDRLASPDLLVGLLVATLPARDRLPSRPLLVTRIRRRLTASHPERVTRLMKGLE